MRQSQKDGKCSGPVQGADDQEQNADRPLQDKKVLLVEDDDLNQDLVLEILEQLGARVTVCWNGAEALTSLQQASFDCVLMDCNMPVMDGYDATRKLRKIAGLETLPVIALTAGDSQHERQQALDAGMDEFLTKPFKPPELKILLCRILL
ncbi:response regulator [Gynuella sunshinyii]|uniref:Response regulator consisting of a CheY-like receiver domain and a winged-helix DNA-binding domain n=1 Tax=Gynuella sunshinyii YC6258 TaxID=1445510 RepID=A0A0C5VK29_9GAMM|nr:response regulator [Gynuella sunshinyii]AJQ95037.1 response regulator consisting of a CheY-like receiver domain and a winged-helix DNA-binding domain [Gynuella sunshinyii YC6258]